jgi:Zn-dependent protease with chaperone function
MKMDALKKMAEKAIFLLSLALCLFLSPVAGIAGPYEREIALGKKVASQVEEQWPVVSNPVEVARVRAVFERLLPFVERKLPYSVNLLDADFPNAFCIPGGGIYVTSGMLDFVRSDGELAAILAHELTHADKNHVMIQAERSQKLSLATLAILIASEGQAAAAMMAGVAQIAITNGYSRDLEREADLGAVDKIHRAGYPAAAALTVMEGLAAEQLKRPYVDPGIFMDHPKLSDRIDYITRFIEDSGWELSRKAALNLLVIDVRESDHRLNITVDGLPVWSSSSENREYLTEVASAISDSLELETSPHDIQIIETSEGRKSLIISGHVITSEPLPKGISSLSELRKGILKALSAAKDKNPTADYLS